MLDEFRAHLPAVYKVFIELCFNNRVDYKNVEASKAANIGCHRLVCKEKTNKEKSDAAYVRRVWSRLPSISIDYGILEKAKEVVTIPAGDMGWSDLGSWESLCEVLQKKTQDNIFKGDIIPLQTKNTFIWGQERLIAAIGLKDLIVVDTKDALLICRKDLSQNVKDIVETLKKKKKELL